MVNGVKVKDSLDGASNFNSWNPRVLIALEENDLLDFVERDMPEPFDDSEKIRWKKNGMKARKILIDFVMNHLLPIISKLNSSIEMFDTLKGIYDINNTSRALALRQQLHHVKMDKEDSVISFFMKITYFREQLSAIGDMIVDMDLVILALNGLPQSWEPFIQRINGRSKLPKFDHLRANCIQEESRLAARGMLGPGGN
ncbi:uncharacterized protein LOC131027480 [Cryptomeria japonica]|uniref:uncharacterized protein LOC131027480 n=1 Tax=Cryptomeria japonica TaxID=3369 RepID=UPI0025ACE767|nr:uncharacterized protein LOC131027480 [Cryptomeria japonica]